MRKWSALIKSNSARTDFFSFLGRDEEDFNRFEAEAQPVVDYIETKIGGKNYWQVSYDELRSLYAAVRIFQPKVMVETGVGPGTTTTAILTAMSSYGGKLYSFDLGEKFGEDEQIPVGYVVPDELRGNWKLFTGDSRETLPREIEGIGPVDMFFHDSDHTYQHVNFELETCWDHASDRFLIAIDNYDWSDAPDEFSAKHGLELFHIEDDMCFIFRKK